MTRTSEIVLATANARYHHTSLSLRCLLANLGPWRERATLLEFTTGETPADIVERVLAHRPRLLGLSVYIWNVALLTEVVAMARALDPALVVVIGGPEVSHALDGLRIADIADFVVQGEGEDAFRGLVAEVLAGVRPPERVIGGGLPDLAGLVPPYSLYSAEDLRQRTTYVEASRGCPYRCEFCLSSLDLQVRHFPMDELLAGLQGLIDRGARNFKFIDRTFNLRVELGARILQFFLDRYQPGMLFHFEVVPDRLPEALRTLLAAFPEGSLQLEIGVQTLDDRVAERISRRQNVAKMEDNFRFLRERSRAHVHADLIVGLPGEGLESFGRGLDRLYAMGPQEIQVGILKRLRGAPIARHDSAFGMVYSAAPPYEILRTDALDFPELQRLKRFAFVWDRLINRGNLSRTAPLLFGRGGPFGPVLAFADALYATNGQVHAIALDRLAEQLVGFLLASGADPAAVTAAVVEDYRAADRLLPRALGGEAQPKESPSDRHRRRQLRHL